MVLVLLSASVQRFSFYHMRDFFFSVWLLLLSYFVVRIASTELFLYFLFADDYETLRVLQMKFLGLCGCFKSILRVQQMQFCLMTYTSRRLSDTHKTLFHGNLDGFCVTIGRMCWDVLWCDVNHDWGEYYSCTAAASMVASDDCLVFIV